MDTYFIQVSERNRTRENSANIGLYTYRPVLEEYFISASSCVWRTYYWFRYQNSCINFIYYFVLQHVSTLHVHHQVKYFHSLSTCYYFPYIGQYLEWWESICFICQCWCKHIKLYKNIEIIIYYNISFIVVLLNNVCFSITAEVSSLQRQHIK
jgi:hypothetical protein